MNYHHGSCGAGAASRGVVGVLWLAPLMLMVSATLAGACTGHPRALGVTRTIAVDPAALQKVGTLQYVHTLPLRDHEVALTFDDGPSPATTGKVLDALAADCVNATFFVLGEKAAQAPGLVLRTAAQGHTIGTHTQTHPHLPNLGVAAAEAEIQSGIAAVAAALGPDRTPAPFFRAPYLEIPPVIEEYLRARDLMLWGIDVDSEDWRGDSPDKVMGRIFRGLAQQRKGIILMHDVQPHTAEMLPRLLKELKARGYRIVRVVPAMQAVGALSAH